MLEGDVAGAMDRLARAGLANPDYPALDGVRAQINQATTLQAEIDELLERAGAYRAVAALVDPPEANAAEILPPASSRRTRTTRSPGRACWRSRPAHSPSSGRFLPPATWTPPSA